MYSGSTDDQTNVGKGGETRGRTSAVLATERNAKSILCAGDCRYHIPTSSQRRTLLVGFAKAGLSLISSAYDAVRLEVDIDLNDADAVAAGIADITIVEIKSTNRTDIGPDLVGYFFNITASEMAAAQALKDRYRFLFVNIVRGDWVELSISEVLARAKAMYPAFHIKL